MSRSQSVEPTKLGDLNRDGIVDVFDLTLLRQHIRQVQPLPTLVQPLADINGDGFINEGDSAALIQMIVGASAEKILPLTRIRETAPFGGEGEVSLTREVIARFTMPLSEKASLTTWDTNTQTPGNFYAEAGGRKLLTRAELSGDRLKATLFFLETVPAGAQVTVTFDGNGIKDLLERQIDPAGDLLTSGGILQFNYSTAPIAPVPNTGITGFVYASQPAVSPNGATVDSPLQGVLIEVLGNEDIYTTTAADGSFTLSPCPVGRFFVRVDGTKMEGSGFPDGDYYPFVQKAWEALPGRMDNLAAGNGKIYLPLVKGETFTRTSQTEDTHVAVSSLPGVELTVPANSLFADDGTRGGRVTVAAVAPDRLPEPLPEGLNLPQVITIQTDGPTNFDRPAPITLPNLPDPVTGELLKPGEKSGLWSFNHDTGVWEVQGPMTVSDDGRFLMSDVGVGIRQPGWHGAGPGSSGSGGPPGGPPPPPPKPCEGPCCDTAGGEGDPLGKKLIKVYETAATSAFSLTKATVESISASVEFAREVVEAPSLGSLFLRKIGVVDLLKNSFKCGYAIGDVLSGENTPKLGDFLECGQALVGGVQLYMASPLSPVGLLLTGVSVALNAAGAVSTVNDVKEDIQKMDEAIQDFEQVRLSECVVQRAPQKTPEEEKREDEAKKKIEEAKRAIEEFKQIAEDQAPAYAEVVQALKEVAETSKTLLPPSNEPRVPDLQTEIPGLRPWVLKILALEAAVATLNRKPNIFRKAKEVLEKVDAALSVPMNPPSPIAAPVGAPPSSADIVKRRLYCLLECRRSPDANGMDTRQERFKSSPDGSIQRILRPNTDYRLTVYEPISRQIGYSFFRSPAVGGSRTLPEIFLRDDSGTDSDKDGLSDAAESAIGTEVDNPDTDGDGATDGIEVANWGNPLDNLAVATGVIGTADTPGYAYDVAALNNVAAIADGDKGVAVFNVLNTLNPVRVAQILINGETRAVAMTASHIAAASSSGLAIIAITNPAAPALSGVYPFGAAVNGVAAAGDLAYAGLQNGQIVIFDMKNLVEVDRITLPGSPALYDLAVTGDLLLAITSGQLHAIPLSADSLSVSAIVPFNGGVGAGGRRLRISAGDRRAYVTFTSGYNVFDLQNPATPVLIHTENTNQFGWRQITSNGSGLALAAVDPNSTSDGAHDVSLYDLGSEGKSSNFLTTFPTPGNSEAVSIYNGIGFVADGEAGLSVVNYLAYDNKRKPPAITIRSSSANSTAEEGKLSFVYASVTDDVQVRSVEFYLNGERQVSDGSFPFEYSFIAPLLSQGSADFKLRARAFDTGGNSAWSNELTVRLVPDATPPRVTRFSPAPGSLTGSLRTLSVTLNEPVDTATLNDSSLVLTSAGADNQFGTADDRILPSETGGITFNSSTNMVQIRFSSDLPAARYRLQARAPLADLAGNVIKVPAETLFLVSSFTDSDGDGIPDDVEPLLGLDPTNRDTDSTGVPDGNRDFTGGRLPNAWKIAYGYNPLVRDTNDDGVEDADKDPDLDGLPNWREAQLGTSPFNADSDGDGFDDATEVLEGTDPLSRSGSRMSISSRAASYLNALSEVGRPGSQTTLISPAASYLNALSEVGLLGSQTTLISPAASYLNATKGGIPTGTAIQITSEVVSYKNVP